MLAHCGSICLGHCCSLAATLSPGWTGRTCRTAREDSRSGSSSLAGREASLEPAAAALHSGPASQTALRGSPQPPSESTRLSRRLLVRAIRPSWAIHARRLPAPVAAGGVGGILAQRPSVSIALLRRRAAAARPRHRDSRETGRRQSTDSRRARRRCHLKVRRAGAHCCTSLSLALPSFSLSSS